jgi:uncharacterized membrane protein
LSQFPGALNTENGGINNLGISVGDYCLDAFGNQCHGYRRSANGVFTSIEPSGALDSFAANININGVIVGSYHAAPGPTGLHCFVFVPVPGTPTGFYTTIDVPSTVPGPFFGGFAIRCRGINDLGQIVGAYNAPDPTTGQIVRHGFLLSGNVVTGGVFTPGVFTPIDVPGAARTDPARINNLGQIVGRYMQGGVHHGFLFDGTTYTSIDFPAVPAAKETVAGGINNLGQIVGTYRDANDFLFGFIRTPNASQPPTYTQIVLPGPGQNVAPLLIKAGVGTFPFLDFTSWVGGINDRGQISGEYWGIENLQGLLSGVHVHGFVTAPKQDFEVTGSAVVSGALVSGAPGPISGAFEGDPIGEGSFTLTNLFVPRDIPFGLFVNCGRVPPPLTLVLTTNTGDQISVELLVTLCQTAFEPVPFTGVVSGFYRITGGTGRFGGTSGSGFVTGTFQFPGQFPATLTFTLEGSITR